MAQHHVPEQSPESPEPAPCGWPARREGGESSASEPRSLLEAFEANVRQHPGRTLFLTKAGGRWHELDYAHFATQVGAVRAGLQGLGVGAGDRVGILSKNCVAWAAVAYASYGLCAALVPMYESQLARDWEYILRDSGARVLFVGSEAIRSQIEPMRAALPALEHVIVIEAEPPAASAAPLPSTALPSTALPSTAAPANYAALLRAGEASPRPAQRPAPETPAAFLYTSGTTAEPKGVVLTHRNIWSNVSALKRVALGDERPEQHRTLAFLPWAHAFAHTVELHLVIAIGASMAIAESIEKVADNLLEVQPTVLVAVPRVFIRIHAGVKKLLARRSSVVRWLFRRGLALAREREAGRALSPAERSLLMLADGLVFSKIRARFGGRLRFAISGAALLPREVASFVAALGVTVCEGYGLTETSPIVSANVPGMSRAGSVGRPLPNVRVVIEPVASADAPSGEIVVYGPSVMAGYHGRERETREAFSADGGLRTGDLGYLDADGYLFITGRIKERYKLANGKYVVPSVIEGELERSPFIAEAMVAGAGRPCNVALIVPDRDALAAWAKQRGLPPLDAEALCREASVGALLSGEVERVNRQQKGYERVQAFRLLGRSFADEEGLLTPSLKLRRHKVEARFRVELEALFAEAASREPCSERDERWL